MEYYKKELIENPDIDSVKIGANGMLSRMYINIDLDSSVYYAEQVLKHIENIDDNRLKAFGYHQTGNTFIQIGRVKDGISLFHKGISAAEEIDENMSITALNNSIGLVYYEMGEIDKAIDYYLKAVEVSKELNDPSVTSTLLNNIGGVYYKEENYELALNYFEDAASIRLEYNDTLSATTYMMNIAVCHNRMGKHAKGLEILQKCQKLIEIDSENYVPLLKAFSGIYQSIENYPKAIEYVRKALETNQEKKDIVGIKNNYEALYSLYEKKGDIEKAYEYKGKFQHLKDSLDEFSSKEQIAALQANFESERKEKTIQLLEKENKLKELENQKSKTITYALSAGGVLLLILSLISFRAYRQKQKSNKILEEQNQLINAQKEAINTQKELVEEINKEMVDSITYAQRIQNAILPTDDFVQQVLPNSFVFFKPKDIVSGDFYVVEKVKDKTLFGVVDCTGHGVPGALMSIVGHNGLSKATSEYGLQSPAKILDFLHQNLSETFSKGRTKNIRDGMDVALCAIDFSTYELEFAGAMNPLYIISNGEVKEVKGDKMAIGSENREDKYTNHKIKLNKGDSVYIFSDGYADQFGGDKGKKLKYKPFRDLLLEINDADSEAQKKRLEAHFKKWKGDFQQIDDVCVIGVKV